MGTLSDRLKKIRLVRKLVYAIVGMVSYPGLTIVNRLKISGTATIVKADDHGLFTISNYPRGSYGKLVLVKMKMMQAEFIENRPSTKISLVEKLGTIINTLLPLSNQRVYNFSK